MQNDEKWVIRKPDGELLQSFAIDPAQISVGWFRPDAPGKTREGKQGPLTFHQISKAQSMLTTLFALLHKEFSDAEVVSYEVSAAT